MITLDSMSPAVTRAPSPRLTKDVRRRYDREMFALALPAFGALVAEPLFVMVDSAIVGHLGTSQLAGLGVAAALMTTAVNVFVFLAYATTAAVARLVGAGDVHAAIRQGVDGIWLALLLGAAVVAVTIPGAPALVELFGASPTAAPYAVTYLRISALGMPAMLVVLAATGVLRGLQNTRTPLVVAVSGFTANAGLNACLVYWAGLGIAGSAWGTVIAQSAMAAAYLVVVARGVRRHSSGPARAASRPGWWAGLRPDAAGRTFVLGEFARLLRDVDVEQLPPPMPTPDAVYARGVAMVEAAQALRGEAPPLASDDLDDPWGRGDQTFGRVADEIEEAVRLFADLLLR